MKTKNKYDIVYRNHGVFVVPHFCLQREENGTMCIGLRKGHGDYFDIAKYEMIMYYQNKLDYWENISEKEFLNDYVKR